MGIGISIPESTWSAPVELNNYSTIYGTNRPGSGNTNCRVCGYKKWLSAEDMAWICNQEDKCWGFIKSKNSDGGWLISTDSLASAKNDTSTDIYQKQSTSWRKANDPDPNVEGIVANATSRFIARDSSTTADVVSVTPGLYYAGSPGYSKANTLDTYTVPVGWKFMISNNNIGADEVEGYWNRGGPGVPGTYTLDVPDKHGVTNQDDAILVQNIGFDVGKNWFSMMLTLTTGDQQKIREKWCKNYPTHAFCLTPMDYSYADTPTSWTTVTDYRHKTAMPYTCVLNDGKIDTQPTTKSACDNGFYCTICSTDLTCQRDPESIGLSYVPVSYSNNDKYNPPSKAKGSHVRDIDWPRCPPCQEEYIGTCYENCNITAGIASCVNGQVVKNAGKESLNYSVESAGLCNLDCPSGYLTGTGYCIVPPENRGVGTPLECSGRWQQYGLQCYTPCNETAGIADWNGTALVKRPGNDYVNYQMQSAGLCAQQCPPGASDGGVFCGRQAYSRGIGKSKPSST